MEPDKKETNLIEESMSLLCQWFGAKRRDLPWREDTDPYHVWISEIMLQQTRIEAVIPYYERFMAAFPNVTDLAEAKEQRLLKYWEGLGYYSRARNLKKGAEYIVSRADGEAPDADGVFWPATFDEWKKVPGVGPYTAGAVASIAFGEPVPAVDGNVMRVVSRLLALKEDVLKESAKRKVTGILLSAMEGYFGSSGPEGSPGTYNQALMELGETVCLPNAKPACDACPLRGLCLAYRDGLTETLPVRIPKTKKRTEKRTVLVIRDGENVVIRKRPDRGLLAGLYEFPNTEGHLNADEALAFARACGCDPLQITELTDSVHIFSHIRWEMKGYLIRTAAFGETTGPASPAADDAGNTPCIKIKSGRIEQDYPIPSAFRAYTPYANIMLTKELLGQEGQAS